VNILEHCSYSGRAVILASGGLSFPKLGVSDIGYKTALKFGHEIVPVMPGLSALKTDMFPKNLAGVSLEVRIKAKKAILKDSLLFTHFGIGGPAAYRASMFDLNADFHMDFLPDTDVFKLLKSAKDTDGAKQVVTVLSKNLPERFAKLMFDNCDIARKKVGECKDTQLKEMAHRINDFIIPGGTLRLRGFQSAEVTSGGIATDEISSKTFQSKLCPGLYFVGEILDITGDLGGFNLHFAFASGSVSGIDCAKFHHC
jgi:predicted Rossmann fold flavoprotein